MRKKYAALVGASVIWVCQASASASPASDYEQLKLRLFSGERSTIVFSPSKCTASGKSGHAAAIPTLVGGFVVRDFIEIPGTNLAFANEHLTVNGSGNAVRELQQYRIKPDGTVTVTAWQLSPTTYEPLATPMVFECTLGDGVHLAPHER